MSASNHASYSKIGFTVFAGIIAIVAVMIYLGGIQDDANFIFLETYCERSVSGLSVGSPVNFRGVKLGMVRDITFVGNDYPGVDGGDMAKIRVVMALNRRRIGISDDDNSSAIIRRYIQHGLNATVTASGITGLSRIELDLDPNLKDFPKIAWIPKHAYIPCKVSLMDSFSDSATKVMNQINRMDINAAWSNVNASVSSLARATEGVCVMINSRHPDLERIMDDLSETTSALKELSTKLNRNPSLLIRDRKVSSLPETE